MAFIPPPLNVTAIKKTFFFAASLSWLACVKADEIVDASMDVMLKGYPAYLEKDEEKKKELMVNTKINLKLLSR